MQDFREITCTRMYYYNYAANLENSYQMVKKQVVY